MRVMVFSDVHANLAALEAVLADAGAVDAYWFLGDLVGYGPEPNECITRVRALPNLTAVLGNHDAAVVGRMPLQWFNSTARQIVTWTRTQLTVGNSAFLAECPELVIVDDITLAHGSPAAPVTEYIFTPEIAANALQAMKTDFGFVGHTHYPAHWQEVGTLVLSRPYQPHRPWVLTPRAILNPGSVGQPRDGDPRAAYALYDTETHTWEWRRVAYDIAAVQAKMKQYGMPERNILRLALGR